MRISLGLAIGFTAASAAAFHLAWTAPPTVWPMPQLLSAPPPVPPPAAMPIVSTRIHLPDIVARPLFSPTRRPPPLAQVSQPMAPPPPPPLDLTLIGTMVGPQSKVAIVMAPGAPASQRFSVGQTVAGWEIVEIARDRIRLRAGTQEQDIRMLPPSQRQPMR